MEQLTSLLQKAVALMNERPEKFAGVKSYQAYSQMIGTFGGYVEIWEFESMNDIDTFFKTMFSDEELKKIPQEFFGLLEAGTYHTQVWTTVAQYRS